MKRRIPILVLVVCSLFLVFASQAFADKASCDDARHAFLATVDEVPTTLEGFSVYAEDKRHVLFAQLDPQTKANIWTAQISDYVAEHPELTTKQLRVIEAVLAFATPERFAAIEDDFLREALVDKPAEGLQLVASKVFTPEQIRDLFVRLGEPAPASAARGTEKQLYMCSCNKGWIWSCDSNSYCAGYCTTRYNACGFLASQICDGLCWQN